MAIVNVKIRNNAFQLSCSDGEESRLLELANKVDQKINDLAKQLPRANDLMLLAMTSIMLEDRVKELEESAGIPEDYKPYVSPDNSKEEAVSDSIDIIAEYIENLTNKLENQL